MSYYPNPRKKCSPEAIAKWTENSRKQDRTNHPFNQRNSLLRGEIMAELDESNFMCYQDTTCIKCDSVDGDKSPQQLILERTE